MVEPRYIVSAITGYLESTPDRRHAPSFWGGAGASFSVLDRADCYRLMASYRSEDQKRFDGGFCSNATRIAGARLLAHRHAARLNGEEVPPLIEPVRSKRFRPTCPNCKTRQPHDVDTCFNCGAAIYAQRRG